MGTKVWAALGIESLIFAVLLFGAAGTVRWPAGWAFLILFAVSTALVTWSLARHDPVLLMERMKPPIQKAQPLWDRIFMAVMLVLFPGWLILMGLDAVRFGWSAVPVWLQWVGGAGVALSMSICHRAFLENTFAAAVVKIQAERSHTVISSGPYAVVRHPLYAGALIFFPATALMLGSWWGVAGSVVLAGGLVFRTAMEDRELKRGLVGYREYAARVRYRLIPFVW